jgi:hypothetical protein
MKNVKSDESDLIVMGDLPRKNMKNGLIVMGDLSRWKMILL